MKKLVITDLQFKGMVSNICRDIHLSNWVPDYVVGITRGGLIPATMISHYLEVPLNTLKVSTRDDGECESNLWMAEEAFGYVPTDMQETYRARFDPAFRKNILIVDDINDSGKTLNWIKNDWQSGCLPKESVWNTIWNNSVRVAVLVDNLASQSELTVDYCGVEIDKNQDDVWVEFPWEAWWR